MKLFRRGLFLLLLMGVSAYDCDSDRPNSWATHRTLYVPKTTRIDDDWAAALCCVYTHVETFDRNTAVLELYDGSSYRIAGASFAEIAERAMDDICDMSMGSRDCRNQADCIDAISTYNFGN